VNEASLGCWIDGVAGNAVPVDDRGLAYGDGLFETVLVRAGRARFLESHLARLTRGCAALGIRFQAMPVLRTEIAAAVARAPELAVLKIIVTRGSARRRGYASQDETARRIVTLWPAGASPPSAVDARLADLRLGEGPALAGIKHLNRLENVLAASEAAAAGVFESLLLDLREQVVCGTRTNVFIACDGKIATPRVDRNGVAGILRSIVMRECAALGLDAEERTISRAELFAADELFVTNARIGVVPVRRLGEHAFRMDTTARRLATHIEKLDA
jgi:4-amino-4-deoxychorismate lyase